MKIKKFNQLFENMENNRQIGHYWVKFPNDKWTIGHYNGTLHDDGSSNDFPWDIIGSDNIHEEKEFESIGPFIGVSPETTKESTDELDTLEEYGYKQLYIEDLVGIKVKKLEHIDKTGDFEIHLFDKTFIEIGCAGGATTSVEIDPEDSELEDFNNTTISRATSPNSGDYEIQLSFNNGKTIILSDDTGGEGLEIFKNKKN